MDSEDKKICKIGDERLVGYEKRTRSGSTQVFYTGGDERDFDRYRAEGGTRKAGVEMHDKPDTIRMQPPEKHYYSSLIGGEWWWVDGCAACNGKERNWTTYIECETHDVCRSCLTSRDQIEGSAWGHRDGWQCDRCHCAEHKAEKESALDAMPEEHDSWDYHDVDEITCPYCAYRFSDSFESADDRDEEHECPRCDNAFKVTAVHCLTFNCDRISQ